MVGFPEWKNVVWGLAVLVVLILGFYVGIFTFTFWLGIGFIAIIAVILYYAGRRFDAWASRGGIRRVKKQ